MHFLIFSDLILINQLAFSFNFVIKVHHMLHQCIYLKFYLFIFLPVLFVLIV